MSVSSKLDIRSGTEEVSEFPVYPEKVTHAAAPFAFFPVAAVAAVARAWHEC